MKPLTLRIRGTILVVITLIILVSFIMQLVQIQVVEAGKWQSLLDEYFVSTQSRKAVRGEIVDRNGVPLAVNQMGYDLIIDKAYFPRDRQIAEQNAVIDRLMDLCEKLGEPWTDNLPVSRYSPFSFEAGMDAEVERLKKQVNVQPYAPADDVMYNLIQKYKLQDYSLFEARKIAGVRYEMERRDFSIRNPYTFAVGLNIDSVIRIKEHSYELPGIDIVESAGRVYKSEDLAPHIIGFVGPLYLEEYNQLKKEGKIFNEKAAAFDTRGYTMDDTIGKQGVESAFEEYLRGQNGKREITVNSSGSLIDAVESIPPIPGNTVMLSLDTNLQRTAQEALEAQIKYLQETAPEGEGKEACAGSVAMIEVETGNVLVLATYPSYNLSTYRQDYASLLQEENRPLVNRAINGLYAPGSTYKPVVALTGLSAGLADEHSTVFCSRVYTFYEGGYQPTCLDFHGNISVTRALSLSCNIFFYDLGRRAGIDAIDKTARSLGLGEPTGIEIFESKGQRSNPDVRLKTAGVQWSYGDVLQSSIGQLDNRFTPLQLANYAATIGNRGKRMKLTLVHEIRDYSMKETEYSSAPQVAEQMDVPPEAFETVIKGMVEASRTGSARGTFANYPIDVAAKTGTPQTSDQEVNSTFICFAPAEAPKVAIAVVIEKGWHGYTGAPVAKALFDEYFGYDNVRAPVLSGPQRMKDQLAAPAGDTTPAQPAE